MLETAGHLLSDIAVYEHLTQK